MPYFSFKTDVYISFKVYFYIFLNEQIATSFILLWNSALPFAAKLLLLKTSCFVICFPIHFFCWKNLTKTRFVTLHYFYNLKYDSGESNTKYVFTGNSMGNPIQNIFLHVIASLLKLISNWTTCIYCFHKTVKSWKVKVPTNTHKK